MAALEHVSGNESLGIRCRRALDVCGEIWPRQPKWIVDAVLVKRKSNSKKTIRFGNHSSFAPTSKKYNRTLTSLGPSEINNLTVIEAITKAVR
jgi:hypothetical protein